MPKNTNAYASLKKRNCPAIEREYYSEKGCICRMKISDGKYFFAISSICLILNSKFAQKSVHRCTIFCAFQIHAIFFPKRFKIYCYNKNTFYSLLTQLFIQLRKYLRNWGKNLSHQRY